MSIQSQTAVIMFAEVGRIRLVALYVSVKIPLKISVIFVPAVTVPNDVIVVVPVTVRVFPVATDRSVVVAEAMSAPCAPCTSPVNVGEACLTNTPVPVPAYSAAVKCL